MSAIKSIYMSILRDLFNPKPALIYLLGIVAQWSVYFLINQPDFFQGENPMPFDLYWPTVIGSAVLFLVACSKSLFAIPVAFITSVSLVFFGYGIEGMVILILIYIAIIITSPFKPA